MVLALERELIHKTSLTSLEMLALWVRQEGNRYEQLLIERGFLQEQDRENDLAYFEAAFAWRKTYTDDLELDACTWELTPIERPTDVIGS